MAGRSTHVEARALRCPGDPPRLFRPALARGGGLLLGALVARRPQNLAAGPRWARVAVGRGLRGVVPQGAAVGVRLGGSITVGSARRGS
jgi:hypothetical protein